MTGSATSWREARRLFHRLHDLAEDEREAELSRVESDRPELVREVRTLFGALAKAGGFLQEPLAVEDSADNPIDSLTDTSADTRLASPFALPPGERIGRYRLLDELGFGGMGAVYLAERADDEYREQVALKLLRPEVLNDSTVERFRTERQLLADLRHPAIAQLLDGGTTDDGQPFLVMEYVEGEPLDVYCDRLRLGIRSRLELFRRVCDAVHVAHQSLVVHRDLKPANVLVTADGDPKLLDFGVAKLLEPTARFGALTVDQAPMTLEYASPEQLRGEAITTASDVYSLGVMLFELLVGRRPFAFDQTPLDEVVRQVRDAPRPLASEVFATDPRAAEIAEARGAAVDGWCRRLRGDLDTIMRRALHRDPARRYHSAVDLGDDLGRWLEGRPIRARPDSLGYRTRKFVIRHRWAVTGLATLFFALVVFSSVLWWQRGQLQRETALARESLGFAEQIFALNDAGSFRERSELQRLFGGARRGDEVTARELLDRAAETIGSRFSDRQDVRSGLLTTLGTAFGNLGEYERAERLLRRALLAADDASARRARLRLADNCLQLNRLREADDHYRYLLGDRSSGQGQLRDAGDEIAERALFGRARVAIQRNRFDAARRRVERGLRMANRLYGADDRRTLEVLALSANLYREQEKPGQAIEALGEVRERVSASLGPTHPLYAEVVHDLALALVERGRYQEALDLLRDASETWETVWGPDHPIMAQALHNRADVLRHLGRLDEAVESLERSLAIRRRVYGDDHPLVALGLNLLGVIHSLRGAPELAEPLHRQALDVWTSISDAPHSWPASAEVNLATALAALGRADEAREAYRSGISIYDQVYGADSVPAAKARGSLAALERREGALVEARQLAEDSLRVLEPALGPEQREVAAVRLNLAQALWRLGDHDDAAEAFGKARDGFRANGTAADLAAARVASFLRARNLALAGDPESARDELRGLRERVESESDPAAAGWLTRIDGEVAGLDPVGSESE